jgi:hypothetical protein
MAQRAQRARKRTIEAKNAIDRIVNDKNKKEEVTVASVASAPPVFINCPRI